MKIDGTKVYLSKSDRPYSTRHSTPCTFNNAMGSFKSAFQLTCKDEGDQSNGLTSPPNEAVIWNETGGAFLWDDPDQDQ